MRSRTAEWFEAKVRYDKIIEDGSQKSITETYVVDALSFTEAEESITEEMSAYISGEFDVSNLKKAAYKEIFFSDDPRDDKWYKVKLQFIIIDEKSGKEKLSAVNYLVQSRNLQGAVKNVEEVMDNGMQDWKLAAVTETMFLDVFEHDGTRHVNKPKEDDRPEYLDAEAAEAAAEAEKNPI